MGATFLAIAADHPLARHLEAGNEAVAKFCADCRRIGTSEEALEKAEKLGFDTGLKVAHPLDADWHLPVYIANFVLMEYGAGAIFGCPAHDQRDLDFARKYGLDVIPETLEPSACHDHELPDKLFDESSFYEKEIRDEAEIRTADI